MIAVAKEQPPLIQRLTNQSLALAAAQLAARDRHLRSIYQAHGVPPMWSRQPGFRTLLRIVLEQQVSLISAQSMYERLRSHIDPFDPLVFIDRGEAYLRSVGMTRRKRITRFKLRKHSAAVISD